MQVIGGNPGGLFLFLHPEKTDTQLGQVPDIPHASTIQGTATMPCTIAADGVVGIALAMPAWLFRPGRVTRDNDEHREPALRSLSHDEQEKPIRRCKGTSRV